MKTVRLVVRYKLCMVNPVSFEVHTILDSENHDWRNGIQVLGTVTFEAVYEPRVMMQRCTAMGAENPDWCNVVQTKN